MAECRYVNEFLREEEVLSDIVTSLQGKNEPGVVATRRHHIAFRAINRNMQ
jgi:hypothetical protein